jgi:outer membrane protein TolC
MKHFLVSIMTLAALGGMVATAQPMRLTMDEAMRLAIRNNRDLQMAHLDVEKSDYKVTEAIGNALPNISASGQYSRAIKKMVYFLPDFSDLSSGRILPVEIGADNSLQGGFSATQILFNSAVFTGVGTAKIYQKASRELYRSAYNSTIANVKRAYSGVLFVQRVLDMTRASLKNAEDNYKSIEIRNKQGIVSDYDLIRAEVQVANVRPMVLQRERDVVAALNGLKILLGMDPSREVIVTGDLEFQPVDAGILETAERTATDNNATIRALQLQAQVNKEMISIYRSEYLPTLAAFGNYTWQAQKNDFRLSSSDFVQSSSIGLSLSINLFSGFQSNARVNQASVDYRKSEEQLNLVRDATISRVQTIRIRLEEARQRIDVQKRSVEQAEKGYKIAVTRYESGSGTQLEVNDADVALMTARVNRVQAIYDYAVAAADLEETLSLLQPETE